MTPWTTALRDRNVLLVEDDYFIADDLRRAFEDYGVIVAGPYRTLEEALERVTAGDKFDGAVLDINLNGEFVWPLADMLVARHVPFVFATGYDRDTVPERFSAVPLRQKPAGPADLARAMFI